MELATGALGTLLPKLGELLQEEYNMQRGVKQGIEDLRDELVTMQAALVKLSDVPLDLLDLQVKVWANDVRELSYAIEDSLDSSMVRLEDVQPNKSNPVKSFIDKTINKITKLKARHEIASDIKDIESQVRKVKERYDRYKIGDVVANPATTIIDPRLSAMYNKVANLVGIDKAIEEITERLSDGDGMSEKNLRAISIVGFGGLGKTTLAKAVYDKLNKKFDCGSFVSVGRNPDMKKVFRDILHELDKVKYMNITSSKMDAKQLIDELQGFLADKRYLIVMDDIWDIPTWDRTELALLDCNPGSRIITTTRIHQVAEKVGGVYNMKPLSDDNSKKLFFMRIRHGESVCPDNQSLEVTNKILKKCGGVPLAITTFASLLVGKPRDDWATVYEAIGFGHEDNIDVQDTRKILSFSYYDLPSYLKTCLLYVSVFPEDYLIEKNLLIWRWVCEGFVPDGQGGSFKQGENYFNTLVNRSMIQWIEPNSINPLGGCRVHDMVLDLINTISGEVNFVTIQHTEQPDPCPLVKRTKGVRRLALHRRSVEYSSYMKMKHVRSFHAITCRDSTKRSLLLTSFKVLRVLVLEKCDFSGKSCSLEHLGKLVQLRYLGLVDTCVDELPSKIGRELQLLQTLDVRRSGIKELPASVGELSKLMCLCVGWGTVMVGGIGKLTSMQELRLRSVVRSPNFFTELGQLTEVRVLDIHFDEMDESAKTALAESLHNLPRIQCLHIHSHAKDVVHLDGGWEKWEPCSNSELRELFLSRIFLTRRPLWMDSVHVPHLSFLSVNLKVVEAKDVQILGRLSALARLRISTENDKMSYDVALSYTVGSGEFRQLECLEAIGIFIICGQGALPMLRKLECCARVGEDVGLVQGNMPLIEDVTYLLDCKGCSAEEVDKEGAALWRAAEIHPNRPALKIIRYNYAVRIAMQRFRNLYQDLMWENLMSIMEQQSANLSICQGDTSANAGRAVHIDPKEAEKNQTMVKSPSQNAVPSGVSTVQVAAGVPTAFGIIGPSRTSDLNLHVWAANLPGQLTATGTSSNVLMAEETRESINSGASGCSEPLGLGLGGGLPPKRQSRIASPSATSSDPVIIISQEAVLVGKQVLQDYVSKIIDSRSSSSMYPISQVDMSSMLSRFTNNPAFGNLLSYMAAGSGLGSPADLRSMIEGSMQHPEMIHALTDMLQNKKDFDVCKLLRQAISCAPFQPQGKVTQVTREEEEAGRKQILAWFDAFFP